MNGQLPFEGDSFVKDEILKLKYDFNIKTALETGSQFGSSLRWFMDSFDNAFGCEPNKNFFDICLQKNLILYNEDSITFLNRFKHENNILIFIDSHWEGNPCPLKDELTLISEFDTLPVIVIHDFKVPGKDFGFDTYDYELCFEEIEPYLQKIYPKGFDYHYNTETNGANRGIIYIYPKQ